MLADAPGISDLTGSLLEFIGDDVLVGHRILFDYSFVKKAAVNQSMVFNKMGIDTLKLSRKFLPSVTSHLLTLTAPISIILSVFGFSPVVSKSKAV